MAFLHVLSSPLAIAVYLVILFISVVFLAVSALKTADEASSAKSAADQAPSNASRFPTLTEIDRRAKSDFAPSFRDDIGLKEFCDAFRAYAAARHALYYGIEDIRRFVASLGVSRLLILQGMSGTGKTSLASVYGSFIGKDSKIIPIQPTWKERSDVIGYFNEFTSRFNEGELLTHLYEASYSQEIFVTVLDEMNIARVEYYFADFLSLLELPDSKDRLLEVVCDTRQNDPALFKNGKLPIPDNVWFIGTANNDDSTFAISDKVYDRAMIINLDKKAAPFTPEDTDAIPVSYARFRQMADDAIAKHALSRRTKEKIDEFDEYLAERFRLSFGNRIKKQIEQYVPLYIACGGSESDALDDILSKKVLRKLEAQNPIFIRNGLDDLGLKLDELFGKGNTPLCKAYLEKLKSNV